MPQHPQHLSTRSCALCAHARPHRCLPAEGHEGDATHEISPVPARRGTGPALGGERGSDDVILGSSTSTAISLRTSGTSVPVHHATMATVDIPKTMRALQLTSVPYGLEVRAPTLIMRRPLARPPPRSSPHLDPFQTRPRFERCPCLSHEAGRSLSRCRQARSIPAIPASSLGRTA